MAESSAAKLNGWRILIVEDEYLIAADMAWSLEGLGVSVIGPVGSVRNALALISAGEAIDAAILDINLGGEKAYPVAAALQERGIPFVFTTGYDRATMPDAYAGTARLEKPVDFDTLARALLSAAPVKDPGAAS